MGPGLSHVEDHGKLTAACPTTCRALPTTYLKQVSVTPQPSCTPRQQLCSIHKVPVLRVRPLPQTSLWIISGYSAQILFASHIGLLLKPDNSLEYSLPPYTKAHRHTLLHIMSDTVTVEYKGRIALIMLSDEKKLNALNQDSYYKLAKFMREIAMHDEVFITVLTGKGRFFSAYAIPFFLPLALLNVGLQTQRSRRKSHPRPTCRYRLA